MPHSDHLDREQEHFNRNESRKNKIFKVVEILFWLIVTIIGVGLLVLCVLSAYNL